MNNHPWQWTAVGKHPAAADYIKLDQGTPLLDALADWMAKGYDEINRNSHKGQGLYSWRFWLRGAKKGTLICGVLRDSSDRIGRPYPLLIMGEGSLKKWEKKWELLPLELSKTWQRMEHIAAHRYEDTNIMTGELRSLTQPGGQTEPAQASLQNTMQTTWSAQYAACKMQLRDTARAIVQLNNAAGEPLDIAHQWHKLIKDCCPDTPRAVFWGGTPQQTYLCIYQNALSTLDFVKLWNV